MKTSELSGTALDWAAAKCEGLPQTLWMTPDQKKVSHVGFGIPFIKYRPSSNWAQGGPIIEMAGISTAQESTDWVASLSRAKEVVYTAGTAHRFCSMRGTTLLIAAMRCYVASKLGDDVEIPDSLA